LFPKSSSGDTAPALSSDGGIRARGAVALMLLVAAIAYLVLAPAARADDSIPSVAPAGTASAAGEVGANAPDAVATTASTDAVPAAADAASTTAPAAADAAAAAATAQAEVPAGPDEAASVQYHEAETPQYHDTEAVSVDAAPIAAAPEPAPANVRSAQPAAEPKPAAEPVQAAAVSSAAATIAREGVQPDAPVVRAAMRLSTTATSASAAPRPLTPTPASREAAQRLIEVAKPTTAHVRRTSVLPKPNSRAEFQFDGARVSVSPAVDSVISGIEGRKVIEKPMPRSRPAVDRSIDRSISHQIVSIECPGISSSVQGASILKCAPEKQAADGNAAYGLEHAAHDWLAARFAPLLSERRGASALHPDPAEPVSAARRAKPAPIHASTPRSDATVAASYTSASPGQASSSSAAVEVAKTPPASTSPSSRNKQATAVTSIAGRLSRTLLRPLGVAGPFPPPAQRLHDTRLMLQIGMLLGLGYLGFLTLWFWRTRFRGRLGRSARV
jgi:hypothetical protein